MLRTLIIGVFILLVFFVVSETSKDEQAFSPLMSALELNNITRMADKADRRRAKQIPVSSGWAFQYDGSPCADPPPVTPIFDPNIAIYMCGAK